MALERLLIAALGIGIGSAIGFGLGWWVLGQLDITASGIPVVPPMLFDVQGWLVTVVLASLAAVVLLSIVLAGVWVNRLNVPEVIRAAE